jgi:DNA-binding HxlR family transcriptional regulator
VRGSQTGRPIMAALDLLGRRWILRILWELRDGQMGFRTVQARCDDMSPSVLSQRLNDLLEAKLVQRTVEGLYGLTGTGQDLLQALAPLQAWAQQWTKQMTGNNGKEVQETEQPSNLVV